MRYLGKVFRPPSEAYSYLLQVTYGCTHNRCAFCAMYLDKKFSVRPVKEVLEDIAEARAVMGDVRRVFLCDGDAMALSTERLTAILEALEETFPTLERVGVYANAINIMRKRDQELRALRKHKLAILYFGLESGDDGILEKIDKGATSREMVEAVQRVRAAGFKASVIALLGLGGRALSRAHALGTARVLNEMDPDYVSFLTVMPVPGTPLHQWIEDGEMVLPDVQGMLVELRQIISGLELSDALLRTNHASNYAPIKGHLPGDKEAVLQVLDDYLSGRVAVRPDFLRGL